MATFLIIAMFGSGMISILTGSLLSVLMFKGVIVFEKIKVNYYFTFILLIAIYAMGFIYTIPYLSQAISTFLFGYVIIINLSGDNFLSKILNNPILSRVGVMSYSIYIWQQIFTDHQPWQHLFKYADSPFLNLPVMFIMAYCSYHFFESKFLKLKHRFQPVEKEVRVSNEIVEVDLK
jgi:peptidoglycan/LPS O-acetylase OafA/YrhL